LDDVFVQSSRSARNSRRRARQTGLPDRFKKGAASGGTHLHRHINICVEKQFHFPLNRNKKRQNQQNSQNGQSFGLFVVL
jgi:hypothetical protein